MKRAWLLLAGSFMWIVVSGVLFSITQHTGTVAALYWAVATATTVGYGDVTPHGNGGQLLAIGVMLTAIPLLAATFALITGGRLFDRVKKHVDMRLGEHSQAIHARLDHLQVPPLDDPQDDRREQ